MPTRPSPPITGVQPAAAPGEGVIEAAKDVRNTRSNIAPRGAWSEVICLALAVAVPLILLAWQWAARPDLFFNEHLLFGEHGNQLFRAWRLGQGKLLYRDVACQYGFGPVYLFAGMAVVFGNHCATLAVYHVTLEAACQAAGYALLRRFLSPWTAAAVSIVALSRGLFYPFDPYMYWTAEYMPWERLAILGLMLTWRAPAERTLARAALVGGILGAWQTMKFGGAAVGLTAFVLVDLLWLATRSRPREAWRNWAQQLMTIVATFTAIEAARIVLAVSLLPREIAHDSLWPAYMRGNYELLEELGVTRRLPRWEGWKTFLRRQSVPLSFGLLATWELCRAPRVALTARSAPAKQDVDDGPLDQDRARHACLVGLVYFLVATFTYLAHDHHYYQHAWTLIFAGAFRWSRLPRAARLALFLLWLSPWVLTIKQTIVDPIPSDLARWRLPNGETLFVSATSREQLAALSAVSPSDEDAGRFVLLLGMWGGGGWHRFHDPAYDLRNYLFERHVFRPYDAAELDGELDRVAAIFSLYPLREELHRELPAPLAEKIESAFEPAREQPPAGGLWLPRRE